MKTVRTQVKRVPKRGHYDLETVYSILDAGLICHVGFAMEEQPFVIPTAYGRLDNQLFIHGSPASRMLKSLQQGINVCVTVTLLDGLVLARSAMHHSMNYRSVVLFGTAELVSDREEKLKALYAFTEHVVPGRWAETREPNEQELTATTVLALPIDEASAKIRTGPPVDDAADYDLPYWAGVIPLRMQLGEPIVDPKLTEGIGVPEHVETYVDKRRKGVE
ncbi:MAG: pyridoxamine 5'-phosphate oxidase family protein [Cyanobacteria bacterium P01_A01_bin.137]